MKIVLGLMALGLGACALWPGQSRAEGVIDAAPSAFPAVATLSDVGALPLGVPVWEARSQSGGYQRGKITQTYQGGRSTVQRYQCIQLPNGQRCKITRG
jgi:hypothetical protein